MQIGVSYTLALDFMLYQKGGNMWKYHDIPEYAGAQIGLDSDIAIESFEYICRLYSDYSFPVSYDAANRFRTGEVPILVGNYEEIYNKLVVYATEIEGLWEFCPLPGTETGKYDENGKEIINYNSLATVSATVMLHGCEGEEQFAAWEYMQWETSAKVQSDYGNRMVALIGPSAKYDTANINAIKDLSWTADEREALEDQIKHMSSIVNYPGSYIITRYVNFAFLAADNSGADPVDALSEYIGAINAEITR
jgi:ABC-type glycerol-3-phosphate transport system substrate-binding protein